MLVQCGALPCGAVQCSAAQTAELYVRTKYIWAGERTGRSFYASTPLRRTECHALTPPVPAGCRPQLPSCHLGISRPPSTSRAVLPLALLVSPHTLAPRHVLHLSGTSLRSRAARHWVPHHPCSTPAPSPPTTQCSGSDPGACLAAWLRNDGIDNMGLSHRTTCQSLSVPPNPFQSLPLTPSPSQSPSKTPQLRAPASSTSKHPKHATSTLSNSLYALTSTTT